MLRSPRFLGLVLLPLLACGGLADPSGGVDGPPDDQGPPTAPTEPPPTGSKWAGIELTGECGRTTLAYVLVDEVCGGTDDPAYLDYFHAPIMRDGALIGSYLFAVDATYLWVLDTSDPSDPKRVALLAGFGQPLAVATHGGTLLLASGAEGLVVVDPSEPASPVRLATIEVAGPALDVFVDGDRAFVAMGGSGVAVVDLVSQTVEKVLEVPGFAAAVAAEDGRAYVAACDNFAIIDVTTGSVLGQTWVANATKEGILIAPAKDVALQGNVAFVAAGRFGAVAVDITDPSAPSVIGNCTEQTDQSFYASGVRGEGEDLYVAGGEWGVKRLDVGDALTTCSSNVVPVVPDIPNQGGECSTDPPWEVLPWAQTWAPPPVPPEGRDPLQTLPVPGQVYAFGDATRIGLRAIDIRDTTIDDLPKIGRYSEPRLTEGMATDGDRVLIAGKAGGLYRLVNDALVLEEPLDLAKTARAAAFLGDGRWVLGSPNPESGGGTVHIEGAAAPIEVPETIWAGGLATKADTVFVPVREGALAVDTSGNQTLLSSGREAELPQAIAVGEDHLLLAAPEWIDALLVTPAEAAPLGDNGVLEGGDLADVNLWHRALPRRVLLETATGPVEIASLGGMAGLTDHTSALTVELPAGDYIAGAAGPDRVYAVAVDRGRYRTMLVTIALDGEPTIAGVSSFTGMGTSVVVSGDRLLLADGDRGVRIFDTTESAPTLLAVDEIGGAP
ncbi:MAG: hypothetical protein JNL21_27715 [Myxococcales bacterium]|nr:hypothetical protein [Myxococcales bacterium]